MQSQSKLRLQNAMAVELVKEYCYNNKLSIEKLKRQRFSIIYDECIFSQPSNIKPNGLVNDYETRPLPTLILKLVSENFDIIETEYTKDYLMEED